MKFVYLYKLGILFIALNDIKCSIFQLSKQLDSFKGNLEEFAANHRNDIRKSPQFRNQFQEMCAAIGVDPLACKQILGLKEI